jgi:hypothetical protein
MRRMLLAMISVVVLVACVTTPGKPAIDKAPAAKPAAAQPIDAKPDFSGEWTINLAKSDFANIPPPKSLVRKIVQTGASLTIVDEQSGGGNDGSTTRKLSTDGATSTSTMQGMVTTVSAKWEGDAILANTSIDSMKLNLSDRMSLSADGKTLTSEILVLSPQIQATVTIVFDRQ